MSVLTQGTQFFVLKSGVVSEVECITSFNPGGTLPIRLKIPV